MVLNNKNGIGSILKKIFDSVIFFDNIKFLILSEPLVLLKNCSVILKSIFTSKLKIIDQEKKII